MAERIKVSLRPALKPFLEDEYRRTFAVFTLAPSLAGSTPSIPNVYTPPLMPCGTQYRTVRAWAAL